MRYVCIVLCLMFVLTGCAQPARDHAPSGNDSFAPHSRMSERQLAPEDAASTPDRLERLAQSVPGVKSATCVVIGKMAVVGVNVQGNLDRSRVGTIKYSVAEALRKDPVGIHAIVTADIDIGNRLREMRSDMANGKPLSGFAEELADIVGRIMPQFPKDITPLETPPQAEPGQQGQQGQLKNKSL